MEKNECELDECQRQCPFCEEKYCIHSDPCMSKAVSLLLRIRNELKIRAGHISVELEADLDDAVMHVSEGSDED